MRRRAVRPGLQLWSSVRRLQDVHSGVPIAHTESEVREIIQGLAEEHARARRKPQQSVYGGRRAVPCAAPAATPALGAAPGESGRAECPALGGASTPGGESDGASDVRSPCPEKSRQECFLQIARTNESIYSAVVSLGVGQPRIHRSALCSNSPVSGCILLN
jgi:hypothetical protein